MKRKSRRRKSPKYNFDLKKLRSLPKKRDSDDAITLSPEDMHISGESDSQAGIIVISGEMLESLPRTSASHHVAFSSMDDNTVFTCLGPEYSAHGVPGTLFFVDDIDNFDINNAAYLQDNRVRVLLKMRNRLDKAMDNDGEHHRLWDARGYFLKEDKWLEAAVTIVPVREQIFSRFGGLLETDVLSDKRILIIGEGSVGSPVTIGLAQSGIMHFNLVDHDRLEICNIVRHAADISHIGRLKVNVMRDFILKKNPYAKVKVYAMKVTFENAEQMRFLVRESDLVICVPDDRDAKKIINRLCIQENKTLIIAGAFRRAYGGQVLVVHPKISPCFQCFLNILPEQARDEEISSKEKARKMSYSDKIVPVEPGLANDISAINQMVIKLAVQELIKGRQTTMKSLDDDLVAPLYLWINRREKETEYEKLGPLEYNIDGLRIMRWYGIDIPRYEACPECGNFLREKSKKYGIKFTLEDVDLTKTHKERE